MLLSGWNICHVETHKQGKKTSIRVFTCSSTNFKYNLTFALNFKSCLCFSTCRRVTWMAWLYRCLRCSIRRRSGNFSSTFERSLTADRSPHSTVSSPTPTSVFTPDRTESIFPTTTVKMSNIWDCVLNLKMTYAYSCVITYYNTVN